ncbi:YmL10 [Vanrija albida]|uniref:YmL10 n=1 Tax=Vanrija albida TaxID=181172 RepID=A0ABR3Q5P1_9TREE
MLFGALSTVLNAAEASASRLPRLFQASSSRQMSTLHLGNLAGAKGSSSANTRKGRGPGSGHGKQSGRGHKGQNARSGNGKPVPGFAGGQTPIHKVFPKRGFVNFTRKSYAPLALSKLQQFIAQARIDPALPITVGTVVRANAVHGISGDGGVKLLGPADPELPLPPLNLELSRFSKQAAEAVLAAGGKVTAVYHNNLSLRQEVHPHKFPTPIQSAKPIRRTDIEYYTSPAKYGYLAPKEGEAASKE